MHLKVMKTHKNQDNNQPIRIKGDRELTGQPKWLEPNFHPSKDKWTKAANAGPWQERDEGGKCHKNWQDSKRPLSWLNWKEWQGVEA